MTDPTRPPQAPRGAPGAESRADAGPSLLDQLRRGTRNALELLREGRLGAPYAADYEVFREERTHRLRRYTSEGLAPSGDPILLVPPLMVSSEVYDISPELSAVAFLAGAGLDVWLVDYGRPEAEEGGLERTLDDHVLAIDASISDIKGATGRPVHVVGYSQGGMFAYQVAAYRRSADIASVITFGSPVNVWRTILGGMHENVAERVLRFTRGALSSRLAKLEGLPGAITSTGFKLFGAKKEVQQVVQLVGMLPDREALEKREPKRRFLGGEGFVAWPGPAFRKFVDDMVVNNRLTSGGLVLGGRTVSLTDITCPVLYFVGERDDMAKPSAVRAIKAAAPRAALYEVSLRAGHFGLVVGSKAMAISWPSVVDWVAWCRDAGPLPEAARPAREHRLQTEIAEGAPDGPSTELASSDERMGVAGGLYDLATDLIDGLWSRLGEVGQEVGGVVDALRWQIPRLTRVESLRDHTRVSMGQALDEQARAIGEDTFFIWKGRAYSYADANARVDAVTAVLLDEGVKRGHHVGIFMDNHPDVLTSLAAVNRLGGIAVMLNADARGTSLSQAMEVGQVDSIITDEDRAQEAADVCAGRLLVMTQGRVGAGDLPERAIDVEKRIGVALPAGFERNPGRARDLALLMFTSGTTGMPKAARVTNRRWAVAALTAAAATTLTPRDTVYCCLPLHHSTGLLVGVGGALVGGARLALAPRFSVSGFWDDVRRSGATIVVYVGELCRYLVNGPTLANERHHPVRCFVGNGMRPEVWRRLLDRFGDVDVLEFYGSTEGNVALANLAGAPVGSVGRPISGSGDIELALWDTVEDDFARDGGGRLQRCADEQPGVMLARIDEEHPLHRFDGYTDMKSTERKIVRDAFVEGDAWFISGDLLRRDAEGNYWFVDRLGDTFRWKGENVSTEQVQSVLDEAPGVAIAAVFGVELPGREGRAGMAAVQLDEGATFDGAVLFEHVVDHLAGPACPRFVRVVDQLEMTATLKLVKHRLQAEGADPGKVGDPLYYFDERARRYAPLDMATYGGLAFG